MEEDGVIRINVQVALIEEIKKCYPEIEGLTATGIVDWALRYLVKQVPLRIKASIQACKEKKE